MNDSIDAVERRLRALRAVAPAGLRERVLTETGLADGWTQFDAPVGRLYISHNPHGVSVVAPAEDLDAFRHIHATRTRRTLGVETELPPALATSLQRTVETGRLRRLPVDLRGLTEFQRAVLLKTAEIPPGEMRPYGWIAREIGRPGAVRAVGSALNRNPVPVLIPCHRVGRSDGTVGEYAFGPAMKRSLLAAEGADPDELDDLAARGVRLTGSDTTHIFCLPTCRNARRTTARHRVEFASVRDATGAGYRACKVCRPAA